MKKTILCLSFFILVACFFLYPEKPNYCEKLVQLLDDKVVAQKLVAWVDNNIAMHILAGDYKSSTGVVPGDYELLNADFDWGILGFNSSEARIRFVSSILSTNLKFVDVKSVSFAEKSRMSVLVRLSHSKSFGTYSHSTFAVDVDDRIAVFCLNKE